VEPGGVPLPNIEFTEDSPEQGLVAGYVANSFAINDRFEMVHMYRPAGSDSIWVPLNRIDWKWQATGSRNFFDNWPAPVTVVPGSRIESIQTTSTCAHPIWNALWHF
jgi:hypothetical protein